MVCVLLCGGKFPAVTQRQQFSLLEQLVLMSCGGVFCQLPSSQERCLVSMTVKCERTRCIVVYFIQKYVKSPMIPSEYYICIYSVIRGDQTLHRSFPANSIYTTG